MRERTAEAGSRSGRGTADGGAVADGGAGTGRGTETDNGFAAERLREFLRPLGPPKPPL